MAGRNTDPDRSVGSHPIGVPAKKRPAWLWALLVIGALLILAIVLSLLLSRCGGDDTSTTPVAVSTPAATTTAPAPTMMATTDPATATAAPTAADAGGGMLMADAEVLLPMTSATMIGTDGDLSQYTGTTATATGIAVQSVPADEGFWVGSSATDRVWVQLTGGVGESPVTVKKGDTVSFTGKVVKNSTGFAVKAGVTDAEGSKLLTAQGQHVVVARSALKLSK